MSAAEDDEFGDLNNKRSTEDGIDVGQSPRVLFKIQQNRFQKRSGGKHLSEAAIQALLSTELEAYKNAGVNVYQALPRPTEALLRSTASNSRLNPNIVEDGSNPVKMTEKSGLSILVCRVAVYTHD